MRRILPLSSIFSVLFAVSFILAPQPAAARTCPDGRPMVFNQCPHSERVDPSQIYDDPGYRLTFGGCKVSGRQVECEAWIDPHHTIVWFFSNRTYLATTTGAQIPVAKMVIGAQSVTVSNIGYRTIYVNIEPGVRTHLVYTFELETTPDQVQRVLIALQTNMFIRRYAGFDLALN